MTFKSIDIITQPRHQPNAVRMPIWIRQNLGQDVHYGKTDTAVHAHRLHTVCEEARCPNRGECWSRGTATFMLLGDICTRACGFCAVKTGKPDELDTDEPRRVTEAVMDLKLRYIVLTSVNRDDLAEGGVGIFAETLRLLRLADDQIGVEFLTPDFRQDQTGAVDIVMAVLNALPDATRRDLVEAALNFDLESSSAALRGENARLHHEIRQLRDALEAGETRLKP